MPRRRSIRHFAARPDGRVQVRMGTDVIALLISSVQEIVERLPDSPEQLRDDQQIHPSLRRLFPVGHASDPEVAAEYAEMARTGLAKSHVDGFRDIQLCLRDLLDEGGETVLSATQVSSWLRGLNAVRLAIGTTLDVGEEDELPASIETDRDREHVKFVYLGQMLHELVEAAHKSVPA